MDIFASVFNFLLDLLKGLLGIVFSFLPKSPFASFLDAMEKWEFLKMLNWIVPVASFVSIGTAWLAAIGIYYAYSVVLRWLKAIG